MYVRILESKIKIIYYVIGDLRPTTASSSQSWFSAKRGREKILE